MSKGDALEKESGGLSQYFTNYNNTHKEQSNEDTEKAVSRKPNNSIKLCFSKTCIGSSISSNTKPSMGEF